MFTGLVQDKATVKSIDKREGLWRLSIQTGLDLSRVDMGASIACNGCCLTVIDKTDTAFDVEVSLETLDKTNIGAWEEGSAVNLEPSLKVGDELGGHLVTGHVDALAELVELTEEGESWKLVFKVPQNLKQFVAPKGSICLDGISLTVNSVDDDLFSVNIIPHTWNVTNLSSVKVGQSVNMEIDLIARYMARMMDVMNA
jgi:riboflavin synthase